MPRSLAIGRRGDHVHRLQLRLQEAGERRRGQRARVHLRDRALIFEPDRADAALGELAGEGAELLGEPHEGRQPRRLLGA